MSSTVNSAPKQGEGKTYSLFGNERDTSGYYERIRLLADDLIGQDTNLRDIVERLRKESGSKRRLKKLVLRPPNPPGEASLARTLKEQLSEYTGNVASHLKGLPLARRWDPVLATSEEQYQFHMLEVEVTNRLHADHFRACNVRFAFLPHCLHDVTVTCQSVLRGHDHVCKGCSKGCGLNAVSKLLRRHGVTPYIWMTANLRSLFRRLNKEGMTVGVLGVACIPELVRGMRMCMRAGVSVIGLPLDANRCARWWGQFHPNTLNLEELERLLKRT